MELTHTLITILNVFAFVSKVTPVTYFSFTVLIFISFYFYSSFLFPLFLLTIFIFNLAIYVFLSRRHQSPVNFDRIFILFVSTVWFHTKTHSWKIPRKCIVMVVESRVNSKFISFNDFYYLAAWPMGTNFELVVIKYTHHI